MPARNVFTVVQAHCVTEDPVRRDDTVGIFCLTGYHISRAPGSLITPRPCGLPGPYLLLG
jgi:hypothetical protein